MQGCYCYTDAYGKHICSECKEYEKLTKEKENVKKHKLSERYT